MSRKIDVMIVGAQKAGTTSLLRYLGEHPACISHPQKEFSYFTDPKEYSEGLDAAMQKFFSHEPYTDKTKIICKNAGMYTREDCLRKLHQNNPDCEIVYILRNPVERTYSSFLMEKNAGSANFEFSEIPELIASKNENNHWGYQFFIDYSLYANHLKMIYKFFPPEKVSIILYEDLKENAAEVCKRLFRKIGVDDSFVPNVAVKHNVTQKTRSFIYAKMIRRLLHNENPLKKVIKKVIPGYKVWKYGEMLREANKTKKRHDNMDERARKYLQEFYRPFNEELEQLIDRDLSHWNQA